MNSKHYPYTVSTEDEFETLPVGTVIMDITGEIFRKNSYEPEGLEDWSYSEWWDKMGTEDVGYPRPIVRVLWQPPNVSGEVFDD